MVVYHDRYAIGGQLDVEFEEAQSQPQSRGKGGYGVFRKFASVAAVGDEMDQSSSVQAGIHALKPPDYSHA
jgi:hypothetical protein